MIMTEENITVHSGCPNRNHCTKDETQCCYLVQNECILDEEMYYEH